MPACLNGCCGPGPLGHARLHLAAALYLRERVRASACVCQSARVLSGERVSGSRMRGIPGGCRRTRLALYIHNHARPSGAHSADRRVSATFQGRGCAPAMCPCSCEVFIWCRGSGAAGRGLPLPARPDPTRPADYTYMLSCLFITYHVRVSAVVLRWLTLVPAGVRRRPSFRTKFTRGASLVGLCSLIFSSVYIDL